jgi:hypothetical protein
MFGYFVTLKRSRWTAAGRLHEDFGFAAGGGAKGGVVEPLPVEHGHGRLSQ